MSLNCLTPGFGNYVRLADEYPDVQGLAESEAGGFCIGLGSNNWSPGTWRVRLETLLSKNPPDESEGYPSPPVTGGEPGVTPADVACQ